MIVGNKYKTHSGAILEIKQIIKHKTSNIIILKLNNGLEAETNEKTFKKDVKLMKKIN